MSRPAARPLSFCSAGRRLVLSFFFLLLTAPFFDVHAQTAVSSSASLSQWVLSASKFENISVKPSDKNDPAAAALLEQLPRLMLNNVSSNLVRIVPSSEIENRELSTLITARNVLFSELTKQIQKRDTAVLSSSDNETVKKNIAAEESKITDIEKKIIKSIEDEKKIREKKDTAGIKNQVLEKPVLWKKDSSSLFTYDKKALDPGQQQRDFENAVIKEKINALITGTVKKTGSFVSVAAVLTLYPGRTEVCRITSAGLLTESSFIAESLMSQMMPFILNAPPVDLIFAIGPAKAAEKVSVFIEDGVYRGSDIRKTVRAGIKDIRIESPKFKTIRFSHNFSDQKEFYINIQMEDRIRIPLVLTLPVLKTGSFSLDAVPAGNSPASVVVDAKPHIGGFVSPEGWQSYFLLDVDAVQQASVRAVIDVLQEDIGESIDKQRKKMYQSYGFVLMAVPLFFITRGIADTTAAAEPAGKGDVTSEEVTAWEIASYVSAAGVAGLLGNMGWNIYKYFTAANRVLPAKARTAVVPAAVSASVPPSETVPAADTVPHIQSQTVIPPKKIENKQKE